MAELIEIGEQQERVILFAASTNDSDDTEESVEELKELVKTAGAETVGTVIQNRENIHPGTYLGKGKIQELKEMVWESGATGVVCDDELSPAQLKNLEDALDTKVMDRTMIILDIFAARAKTREGKIQVELAQLRYRAVRLVGLRNSLSRLGGGIGTRGPGADQSVKIGASGCGAPQGCGSETERAERNSDGGHCRLYECRKVHTLK